LADPHLALLVAAHLLASEATLVWAAPLAWAVPPVLEASARLEALLEDQLAVPPVLEVQERSAVPLALESLVVPAAPLVSEDPDRLEGLLVHLATLKEKTVSTEPLVLALEPLGRLEAPQALEDLAALVVQPV
jgi:hypothetical protein